MSSELYGRLLDKGLQQRRAKLMLMEYRDGSPLRSIGLRYGISSVAAYYIISKLPGYRGPRKDAPKLKLRLMFSDEMADAYASGDTYEEIGKRFGCCSATVHMTLSTRPGFKSRKSRGGRRIPLDRIPVPHWVPLYLIVRYRKIANSYGEQEAARCIRYIKHRSDALKAEAA